MVQYKRKGELGKINIKKEIIQKKIELTESKIKSLRDSTEFLRKRLNELNDKEEDLKFWKNAEINKDYFDKNGKAFKIASRNDKYVKIEYYDGRIIIKKINGE